MKRVIFIYITIILSGLFGFAQNDNKFEKANSLYNNGKYAEAVDLYRSILDSGVHSSELYYNLANAHYKLNNIAPSIYYYEKALQLDPNDNDIKNNLVFANNMTIDDIDVVPEAALTRLINNISNYLSFDGWARTTIIFIFLFVILFLVYYFAFSSMRKRMAFITSIAFLILACITLSLAFHKYSLDKKDRPAIVFAAESKVKSEPNSRSEESFELHEGTKVQILDTVNDWKKIKLADGKTGWMVSGDLKAL